MYTFTRYVLPNSGVIQSVIPVFHVLFDVAVLSSVDSTADLSVTTPPLAPGFTPGIDPA